MKKLMPPAGEYSCFTIKLSKIPSWLMKELRPWHPSLYDNLVSVSPMEHPVGRVFFEDMCDKYSPNQDK